MISQAEAVARMTARFEIEALIAEFAYLIDHERSDDVPNLFTEDGSYGRVSGERSVGRGALQRVYEMRAARGVRTARHLFTNVRLSFESDERANGSCILLLFAADGEPPFPPDVSLVADYEDVFRKGTDDRWRFASRTVRHLFVHPGQRTPVLPLGTA